MAAGIDSLCYLFGRQFATCDRDTLNAHDRVRSQEPVEVPVTDAVMVRDR